MNVQGILKQITWLSTSKNFKCLQQDQVWYNEKKSHEIRTVAHTWQPLCSLPLAHSSNYRRKLPIASCFLVWQGNQCVQWSQCILAPSETGTQLSWCSCFAGHKVLSPEEHMVNTLKCTLKWRVILETPQKPLDWRPTWGIKKHHGLSKRNRHCIKLGNYTHRKTNTQPLVFTKLEFKLEMIVTYFSLLTWRKQGHKA